MIRGARVVDPGDGHRRRSRRARARRPDRRVGDGLARRRRRGRRGRRPHAAARPSSIRTCTCARPGRSTRRTSRRAPPPPPPAASAPSSRCRTPTRWSTPPAVLQSLHERAASEAAVPVGFLGGDLARPARRAARRARRARRRAARSGFSDDGRPVESAGLLRRAFQYASIAGLLLSLHCEDLSLTRGACDARGRRLGRARHRRLPVDRRVADGRARPAHRPLRGTADPPLPPARRTSRSRSCA